PSSPAPRASRRIFRWSPSAPRAPPCARSSRTWRARVGGAVDLHSHTTASDGSLSPRELVRLAVQHGVSVLAITDHDSTDGLADAMEQGQRRPPLPLGGECAG